MDENDNIVLAAYIIGGITCLLISALGDKWIWAGIVGGLSGFVAGLTVYTRSNENINAPIVGALMGILYGFIVHAIGGGFWIVKNGKDFH